jgi:hypothetical protein
VTSFLEFMNIAKRIKEIAIETLIAVILVVAFLSYVLKTALHGAMDWTPVLLILTTGVVFGCLASWFRFAWSETKFWLSFVGLLVVHITTILLILKYTARPPAGLVGLMVAIELVAFNRVLGAVILRL